MVFAVDGDYFYQFYQLCHIEADTQFSQNGFEISLFDKTAVEIVIQFEFSEKLFLAGVALYDFSFDSCQKFGLPLSVHIDLMIIFHIEGVDYSLDLDLLVSAGYVFAEEDGVFLRTS